MLGRIKWYSPEKIHGFITGSDGRDYFFHHSDVAEFPQGTYPEFPAGTPVYFELVDRGRGWQAVNVEAIPEEFGAGEYTPALPAREITEEKIAIENYPFLREIIPTPPEGSEGWWVPIPRKFEEWDWEDRYFYILPIRQDLKHSPVEVEQKIHLVADDKIIGCVYQSYENREDFQRGDTLLEDLDNWIYPARFDYIVIERYESRYDNNVNDWVETKIYSIIDLPRDFGARFIKEKSKVEKMAFEKIKNNKEDISMNKFKLEAFLQEFPFLKKIIKERDHTDIDFIRVARADKEMLNSTPEEYYWNGSAGETSNWERIAFVMKDGTVHQDCVETKGVAGSNYAHEGTHEWEGETVLEALSELENPDDVQYIVWETKEFSDWSGHDRTRTYEITIYKVPKNETLSDILERAKKKAMTEVMAESNF